MPSNEGYMYGTRVHIMKRLALKEDVGFAGPRCFELAIHPSSSKSCIKDVSKKSSAKTRSGKTVKIALDDEIVLFDI